MKQRTQSEPVPPFPVNIVPLRRCLDCKEVDSELSTDGLCEDCNHKRRMQNVINAIAALGKGGTDAECRMKLEAIYDSALPLAR